MSLFTRAHPSGSQPAIALEFLQPLAHEWRKRNFIAERRLAPRYAQHVFDQAVQSQRVLAHDGHQPLLQLWISLFCSSCPHD